MGNIFLENSNNMKKIIVSDDKEKYLMKEKFMAILYLNFQKEKILNKIL